MLELNYVDVFLFYMFKVNYNMSKIIKIKWKNKIEYIIYKRILNVYFFSNYCYFFLYLFNGM